VENDIKRSHWLLNPLSYDVLLRRGGHPRSLSESRSRALRPPTPQSRPPANPGSGRYSGYNWLISGMHHYVPRPRQHSTLARALIGLGAPLRSARGEESEGEGRGGLLCPWSRSALGWLRLVCGAFCPSVLGCAASRRVSLPLPRLRALGGLAAFGGCGCAAPALRLLALPCLLRYNSVVGFGFVLWFLLLFCLLCPLLLWLVFLALVPLFPPALVRWLRRFPPVLRFSSAVRVALTPLRVLLSRLRGCSGLLPLGLGGVRSLLGLWRLSGRFPLLVGCCCRSPRPLVPLALSPLPVPLLASVVRGLGLGLRWLLLWGWAFRRWCFPPVVFLPPGGWFRWGRGGSRSPLPPLPFSCPCFLFSSPLLVFCPVVWRGFCVGLVRVRSLL